MAKFEVLILPIDKVEDHPQADRLSLNHIRGYVAVSNKLDDGSHRYRKGQLVAYVPEGAVVPHSLLKTRGYWDEKKDKGFLAGKDGDRVKAISLRGVLSQGLIFPLIEDHYFATGEYHDGDAIYRAPWPDESGELADITYNFIESGEGHKRIVSEGDRVDDYLGITKWKNFYSYNLPGNLINTGNKIHYEIEDIKKFPNLLNGHQVVVTELLHGILCVVGYDRRLDGDPFFVTDGGMGPQGYVFDSISKHIYTETAKPIWEHIKRYLKEMPAVERFYLFGEIIGPGIQDMNYGLESTEFRALDILMGLMGGGRDSIPFGFVGVRKYELFKWLGIATAPILWGGKFDRDVINELVAGQSSIGGGLRKGVVITSEDENFVEGKRPILKHVADKFLLRNKGTDFK